jgi:hypothetical protein
MNDNPLPKHHGRHFPIEIQYAIDCSREYYENLQGHRVTIQGDWKAGNVNHLNGGQHLARPICEGLFVRYLVEIGEPERYYAHDTSPLSPNPETNELPFM